MEYELVMFQRLPIEVVDIILSYDGTIIRERNKKYMKQIPKTDERYKLLFDYLQIKKNFIDRSKISNDSYTYIRFSDGIFTLYISEYQFLVAYGFLKNGLMNGSTLTESRYFCM